MNIMATAKNGNGNVAKKSHNEAAMLEASHNEMIALGILAQNGKGAKSKAIELFQRDCVAKLATVAMVDTYVAWYSEGMVKAGGKPLVGNGKSVFTSQLAAFGDPNVIKLMPDISATLNQLIGAKDEGVSRTLTGKDKFGQLYTIANKVKADFGKGAKGVIVNAEYVKAAVAPAAKADSTVIDAAKKAIKEQTINLFAKSKPTPAQIKARDEFFKLIGIVTK